MITKIRLLDENAFMPTKEFPNSAGYDLKNPADITIQKGGGVIPLGFAVQLEPGVGMFSLSRSGIELKGIKAWVSKESFMHGDKPRRFRCKVRLGLVDADYRGGCGVLIDNLTDSFFLPRGADIAQVVFLPVFEADFSIVDSLDPSERGVQGFNS